MLARDVEATTVAPELVGGISPVALHCQRLVREEPCHRQLTSRLMVLESCCPRVCNNLRNGTQDRLWCVVAYQRLQFTEHDGLSSEIVVSYSNGREFKVSKRYHEVAPSHRKL